MVKQLTYFALFSILDEFMSYGSNSMEGQGAIFNIEGGQADFLMHELNYHRAI